MDGVCSRFARDYAAARRKFKAAAQLAGLDVETHLHPFAGPDGEQLANDTVWIGARDASRVLVVTAGTHGPELFCGSGAQIDLMLNWRAADFPGVSVLLCHGVNPYGTAWLRRGNEDNIDINRNYIDFSRSLPRNPGYEELHDDFVPPSGGAEALLAADARIEAYGARHGVPALRIATSGGQYTRPDGMFYGGTAPSWSRRTMTLQRTGKSATPPQQGLSSELWERSCGRNSAYVSFEYGTVPTPDVIGALRAEHMLHRQGRNDWRDAEVQRVKRGLLDAFAPDDPTWREMVILQSRAILSRIARGLSREPGSGR